ncbi:anti-sigma regulatory factor (Ser/Thr protein kinase) [Nocardiopsis mwathae]|uniref:Anti-sigma regulatory factor (Ser/Thr protein kinase) n=1 Tax=Nocardiopsis mwathae TaxID=1472723 RepID=A0A7W9YGY5_9ACTN|nr:ATP-binding protein [Nocardiopsis mwathae]MBB6171952.1 anti-sigma regulatory factor (Ser/Thr protein kinase) [Nocardiopsis mwathae]
MATETPERAGGFAAVEADAMALGYDLHRHSTTGGYRYTLRNSSSGHLIGFDHLTAVAAFLDDPLLPRRGQPRSRAFPGEPASVRRARQWVREAGAGIGGRADEAELVVSELVTNALRHSRSGAGGDVDIALTRRPGAILIEVTDEGPLVPGTLPRPCQADPDRVHGRGLALVEASSQRWGVVPGPQRQSTTVWAEVAR